MNYLIDEILNCLEDGKSHSFNEVLGYLRSKCHSPVPSEQKVQIALAFLKKYDFVNSFTKEGTEFWFLHKSVITFWKEIKKYET